MEVLVLEESGRNNCLICNSSVDCEAHSQVVGPKICEELHVMFILQTVLELPKDTLGRFLRKWGSPSEWEVDLCENCGDTVEKAKRIYGEMLASIRKYREVKRDILEGIKRSVERSRGKAKVREIVVTAECRAFVCTREYGPHSDPFVDGDLKAREALLNRDATSQVNAYFPMKTEPQEESCELSDSSDHFSEGPEFGGGGDDAEISEEEATRNPVKVPNSQKKTVPPGRRPCPKSKRSAMLPSSKKSPSKPLPDVDSLHAHDTTRDDGIFCKCGNKYSSKSSLTKHLNRIADKMSGVTHECELCKNANPSVHRSFTRKQELRRHILDYHEGRRSICPLCGKPFIPKKLAYHMRMEHEHGL